MELGGGPPVLAGERPKVPPPGQSGDPGFQPYFQEMGHLALALYKVLRITYNQRGEKGYTKWFPHATWGPWKDHIGGALLVSWRSSCHLQAVERRRRVKIPSYSCGTSLLARELQHCVRLFRQHFLGRLYLVPGS